MNFNFELRKRLTDFINEYTVKAPTASETEINEACKSAHDLLTAYKARPERSFLAQVEYYSELSTVLKQFELSIKSRKSWWQSFCGFFGFILPQEHQLQKALDPIKEAQNTASENYDAIYYPNIFYRAIRSIGNFFGITLKSIFSRKPFDEMNNMNKLKYLSHHLMGNANLNHHKILQGMCRADAYNQFINDLNDFVQAKGDKIDKETKQLFDVLLKEVHQGVGFAYEMDLKLLRVDKTKQAQWARDFAFQIEKEIVQLPIASSLIIPHGYQTAESGHATIVECTRENVNQISFKIINTGAGVYSTQSYKSIFLSFFSTTCPIKVTSPLNIEEIFNDNFIEQLLSSEIVDNQDSSEKMNHLFLKLYNEKKLHDSKQQVTLQTNGTCAHSSLLEWFKSKVSPSTFLLFNTFTLEKAFNRLTAFNSSYNHNDFPECTPQVLADLMEAGKKTVDQAKEDLVATKNRITEETKDLKKQLSTLLTKKGCTIEKITDFFAYSEKKCKKGKLKPEELTKVAEADPMTAWVSPKKSDGIIANIWGLFTKSDDQATLSDRAEKAIIAKKIAAHSVFLENTKENSFYA